MAMLLVLISVSVLAPGRHADRPRDRRGDCARCRVRQRGAVAPTATGTTVAVQHHLGLTALAGLALWKTASLAMPPEIIRARRVVEDLARDSDQTYDLALAILFLARCQQGRRGEADDLIQTLGRRLAQGDHDGIWDYSVPDRAARAGRRLGPQPRPGPPQSGPEIPARFRGRATIRTPNLRSWGSGRQVGTALIRTSPRVDRRPFPPSQQSDGRWGYKVGLPGSEAMSCAGLMGLAIAASRPSLAERQTARPRRRPRRRQGIHRRLCKRSARTLAAPPSAPISIISGRSNGFVSLSVCARSTDLTGTPTAHGSCSNGKLTMAVGRPIAGDGCPEPVWHCCSCARPTSHLKSTACSGSRARRPRPRDCVDRRRDRQRRWRRRRKASAAPPIKLHPRRRLRRGKAANRAPAMCGSS